MWKLIHRSACILAILSLAGPAVVGQAIKAPQAVKSPSELELIRVLKSGASVKDKADACRQLASVGTSAAVPALAELLGDERLAHMARYGLEPIPDPAVDEALRAALGKLKGKLLVGVIGSLGVRRDAKAVEPLAERLTDKDAEVVQAAARSLGRIGTPEAAGTLISLLVTSSPAGKQPAVYEGLFRCAETLAAKGSRDQAMVIYDRLRVVKGAPHQVQVGALRGAILTRGKEGLPLLQEQLRNDDYHLFAAAVRTAQEFPNCEVADVLVGNLKQLPIDRRTLQIQALACVAEKCLQGKDAAEAAARLISPLEAATELSATAELRQQLHALLQQAHKIATKK